MNLMNKFSICAATSKLHNQRKKVHGKKMLAFVSLLLVALVASSKADIQLEKRAVLNVCVLPKIVGPCRAAIPSYFYNSKTGKCEYFEYGGCGGNGNRFWTRDDCENRCGNNEVRSFLEKRAILDVCLQPKIIGRCLAYFRSWYYDSFTRTCQLFIYGGCDGNDNRFWSKKTCEARCVNSGLRSVSRIEKRAVKDTCLQPKVVGPCRAAISSYFYNSETKNCEDFDYGGCDGNDNRFRTIEECESQCGDNDIDSKSDPCFDPPVKGPCRARFRRWYYDSVTRQCRIFFYGGCRGNDNNFRNQKECENKCFN